MIRLYISDSTHTSSELLNQSINSPTIIEFQISEISQMNGRAILSRFLLTLNLFKHHKDALANAAQFIAWRADFPKQFSWVTPFDNSDQLCESLQMGEHLVLLSSSRLLEKACERTNFWGLLDPSSKEPVTGDSEEVRSELAVFKRAREDIDDPTKQSASITTQAKDLSHILTGDESSIDIHEAMEPLSFKQLEDLNGFLQLPFLLVNKPPLERNSDHNILLPLVIPDHIETEPTIITDTELEKMDPPIPLIIAPGGSLLQETFPEDILHSAMSLSCVITGKLPSEPMILSCCCALVDRETFTNLIEEKEDGTFRCVACGEWINWNDVYSSKEHQIAIAKFAKEVDELKQNVSQ